MKHVLTSPGFGEQPDAQGLFSEIIDEFGNDCAFHVLDFYNRPGKDRAVRSIAEQVAFLHEEIDKIPVDDEVILLAKSGGSRPVVSVDDKHTERVSRFVLFVPPWLPGNSSLKENLTKWGGVEQEDGSWVIHRRNGGRFIVPNDYVEQVGKIPLMEHYHRLARLSKLVVIRAMNDKITPPLPVHDIDGIEHIDIEDADHHFKDGDCRQRAIDAMVKYAVL